MKRSQLLLGLLLGALLASALFAYLGHTQLTHTTGANTTKRDLKIAHTLPTTHPVHLGIQHFAKRLNELSGGSITCTTFPSGQLGKETTYLEKLQSGWDAGGDGCGGGFGDV